MNNTVSRPHTLIPIPQRLLLGSLLAVLLCTNAFAVQLEASWACSRQGSSAADDPSKKPEREIRVYRNEPGGTGEEPSLGDRICEVHYLKNGVSEVPWNARNNIDYCYPKAQELADRLNSGGYVCVESDQVAARFSQKRPAGSELEGPESTADTSEVEKLVAFFTENLESSSLAQAMAQVVPSDLKVQEASLERPGNYYLHFGDVVSFSGPNSNGFRVVTASKAQGGSHWSRMHFGFRYDTRLAAAAGAQSLEFLGYAQDEEHWTNEVLTIDETGVTVSGTLHDQSLGCNTARRTKTMRWSRSYQEAERTEFDVLSEESLPSCE